MGKRRYVIIMAAGSGTRMGAPLPKQFLEMHGKPVIIYTLEHFEYHPDIDNIVIVCLADWIEELRGLLKRYGILKVTQIVPGGETGHDSIYNGLLAMRSTNKEEDIVLIHDGVRPLINEELILKNIQAYRQPDIKKQHHNLICCDAVFVFLRQSRVIYNCFGDFIYN